MEILNSCDKEVFKISDLEQVKRFLVLGSDDGTYYISERDLTWMNISSIENILLSDKRIELLELIKSYAGKCKKQEPLIYLLARCCSYEPQKKEYLSFRKEAYELVNIVCTIPTTLFLFLKYTKNLYKKYSDSNGWNNIHKRAICNWYNSKDSLKLIYQMTKYKDRHDYTHRDVFRLSHIVTEDSDKQYIYKYFVKGFDVISELIENKYFVKVKDYNILSIVDKTEIEEFILDYEKIKSSTDIYLIIELIKKHNFAREHLNTEVLNNKDIWKALLPKMPNIALLRNLNKLSICELVDDYDSCNMVINKIKDIKNVHPMHLLIALKMYSSGEGLKGSNKWNPNQKIINALNDKFYDLFKEIKPSNKIVCIALDVSGSMLYTKVFGTECMNVAEIGCALSMIMKSTNPNTEIMGFSKEFVSLAIDPKKRLDDNLKAISNLEFSATDISVPFRWATDKYKKFDAFIVITDNETNSNKIKPVDALRRYRSTMNVPECKLIVVAMAANKISIADPNDRNMLDIAGFDASVPEIINDFISF